MFAFQLGREYKLSVAELWNIFPTASFEYISKEICILWGVEKKDVLTWMPRIWGTIKVIELIPDYTGNPSEMIYNLAEGKQWKYIYGISIFWGAWDVKRLLVHTKNFLKKYAISSRFINKNFKNLSSAQILWEKLIEKQSDFSVIDTGEIEYFGKTLWIQDIESYSKRDYGKTRDMQVGMLPPKLAQMMINFSRGKKIYDPFCWLGTIPIECIIRGNKEVYASDISGENTQKTQRNIDFATREFSHNLKSFECQILDARWIYSSSFLKKSDAIVTEWYLGQVFQKYSITEKKIEEEKKKLLIIYTDFFEGLKRARYNGTIVISFPFWDIRGKYYYFSEIYEILKKYCKVEHLLPYHNEVKHTRYGSLLYKRSDQVVGREIYKLTIIR